MTDSVDSEVTPAARRRAASGISESEASGNGAVVIVHWNRADLLQKCLQALSRQTRLPDQVLIVDNHGTPFTLPAASNPLPIEILRLEQNVGFAAAMNRAVENLEEYDWVASLNPDTEPEPDWWEALVGAAEGADEQVAAFASHLLSAADPEISDGAGDAYHRWGAAWRRHGGAAADQIPTSACQVFSACAAAALYRRQAVCEVGGFDENYFCYFEDVDLGFRLRLAGYVCVFIPDARVAHVGSASTAPRSSFAVRHGHRNRLWCYWKNTPLPLLIRTLPGHLLLNLAVLALCVSRGQGAAIGRAMFEAFRGLPQVLRLRQTVQKKRAVSSGQLQSQMAGRLPARRSTPHSTPPRIPAST